VSGRLVSAVFESALPAWLKPYAAAFATFAEDDGSKCFPSVGRIGRMVGRDARSARRAVAELRRRRVLEIVQRSGRERTTRYFFNARALPAAGDGAQQVISFDKTRFQQVKPRKSA